MTVNELIQPLREHRPDLCVVVDGYEDGYDDLSPKQLQTVKITLNTGTRDYVGTHGDLDFAPKEKRACVEVEEALVLRRTSH